MFSFLIPLLSTLCPLPLPCLCYFLTTSLSEGVLAARVSRRFSEGGHSSRIKCQRRSLGKPPPPPLRLAARRSFSSSFTKLRPPCHSSSSISQFATKRISHSPSSPGEASSHSLLHSPGRAETDSLSVLSRVETRKSGSRRPSSPLSKI